MEWTGMKWELYERPWLELLSPSFCSSSPRGMSESLSQKVGVCFGSARDGALVFGFPDELGDFSTSISILRTALLPQNAWMITIHCAAAIKPHGRHQCHLQGPWFRPRRLITGWDGKQGPGFLLHCNFNEASEKVNYGYVEYLRMISDNMHYLHLKGCARERMLLIYFYFFPAKSTMLFMNIHYHFFYLIAIFPFNGNNK